MKNRSQKTIKKKTPATKNKVSLSTKKTGPAKHIFLSHSGSDTQAAGQFAEVLRNNGHKVWFDKDDLLPGDRWQEQLEQAIRQSSGMIVYVGRVGIEKWVDREVRLGLELNTQDAAKFSFIPVLGPGSNPENLPPFLKQQQCADLRDTASAPEQMRRVLKVLMRRPSPLTREADYWREHSPFRGLQAFDPEHSWLFFGRDGETEQLLRLLGREQLLGVVGNSGSGKSSLVRAGLLPALQRGRFQFNGSWVNSWRVAVFRPGGAPFQELAEALPQLAPELTLSERIDFIKTLKDKHLATGTEGLRNAIVAMANHSISQMAGTRVLLVADQFEELFTLTSDKAERNRYIDSLLAAARFETANPIHIVLTLRGDFYSHCIDHTELGRHLASNQFSVPRMRREQLCQAIEKPLAFAGASPEPGLIEAILSEVGDEPGNLPLLEHALLELWEQRQGQMITHKAYNEIGRIGGALKNRADRVYEELKDPQRQDVARKIFLALTQLGEKSEDTRRRSRKVDLMSIGGDETTTAEVLKTLTDRRLITSSAEAEGKEGVVEVAHEVLIREWGKLREWLDASREAIQFERRLEQAAQDWCRSSNEVRPEHLLRGKRLKQALEWVKEHSKDLSPTVKDFLKACLWYLDPQTGLMWTIRDNGRDIDWYRARGYAYDLSLGGYKDWRLPTIEELEKLYDRHAGSAFNIRRPLSLTGYWVWSSTEEGLDSAWNFDFHSGSRGPDSRHNTYSSRALCVRRPGKVS